MAITPMTAAKLRFVVDQPPVIAFAEILDPKSGFFMCLKRKSNALSTILLLSKAICNVCRVPFDESVKCLCERIVAQPDFWNRCTTFLTESTAAPKKSSKSKVQNAANIEDETEIWQCVTALCQAITNHEIRLDRKFLKNAIQLIENNKNGQLMLDDQLHALKKCLDHKQLTDSRNLCPSLDELTSHFQSPGSRNSVTFNGVYKDVAQYTDIHLALLREDYLLPLRYAVDQIISQNDKFNDPCVYRNVEILIREKEYVSRGEMKKTVCIVADLESERRKRITGPSYYSVTDYSRRLTTGSFLLFTTSNTFNDLIVAKIQSHNPALLERGYIEIVIVKTYNITTIFNESYIMYERQPYFYREIYEILKNFTENTFPMQNDLINFNTKTAVEYPAYVPDQEKVIYKYRKHMVDIKSNAPWSSGAKTFNLTPSQLNALQRSLTQKICGISASNVDESVLIASEIVAILYKNTDRRILIVCHTGNALDKIFVNTEMYTDDTARIANHYLNDPFNVNRISSEHPNQSHEDIFKSINAYRYEIHSNYRDEVDKFTELQSKMERHEIREECMEEYLTIQCRMNSLVKRLQEMRQISDFEDIKSKRIIGITSYAASKFQPLIQLLRSPIVIIVGAQNMLEAQTIAVLTTNLEHLILIGDTKKSRKGKHSNAFALSKIFNTDYSLFERIGNCNIGSSGKLIQTTAKVTYPGPSILDVLSSKSRTTPVPKLRGIERFMIVLDHKEPIAIEFESDFTLALCNYFLKQEYCPEDIAILTVCSKQMQKIMTDRSSRQEAEGSLQSLSQVRIEVLQNFKEKNNGIILLSMATSDTVAWSRLSQEIQTILARTKLGVYVIGSLPTTKLSRRLRKTIQTENLTSAEMELVCHTHGNITKIRSAIDIDNLHFGGCMMVCNQLLNCGHMCNKRCHTPVYPHAECDCSENEE